MLKDVEIRSTRLSIRVSESLKLALEHEAERDRRTVADVVIIMLTDELARRATKKGARRG